MPLAFVLLLLPIGGPVAETAEFDMAAVEGGLAKIAELAQPGAAKEPAGQAGGRQVLPFESASTVYKDLPSEDHNPNKAEQKRLRVEWGKPRLCPEKTYPRLQISGKLLFVSTDGKSQKPVDWPQPVRVLMARTTNDRPDWTDYHDHESSVWGDAIVGRADRTTDRRLSSGEFVASISLWELQRPVGESKPFQLGLCLGTKAGQTVTWTNRSPVLPQSVGRVVIQGPKILSKTLELINACPTPLGWDYDPAAVVRASNHLRSLGKDQALAALREYLRLAYDPGGGGFGRRDPRNIDTSDQWCLATLVPLVFESDGQGGQRPLRERFMTVWEGIPFHTVYISGGSGWPPSTAPLVEWAARHGRVIEKRLRPSDHPLDAADVLFKRLPHDEDSHFGPGLREHLRVQAWRMIGHLVEPNRGQVREIHDDAFSSDEQWSKLKAKAARLRIHWSEQRQEYVVESPR